MYCKKCGAFITDDLLYKSNEMNGKEVADEILHAIYDDGAVKEFTALD